MAPGADPTRPTIPTQTSAGASFIPALSDNATVFTIGPAEGGNGYQGYKYRVVAVGVTGTQSGTTFTANGISASYAEEIAYRSVFTFQAENLAAGVGVTFANGDQVWVRGGNTMTSSTIPGFPLTVEDNWADLLATQSRAGIKLMTKMGTATNTLNNCEWQWVTWEANSAIYVNIYLGRDNDSSVAEVWQFGPRVIHPQTDGFSLLKEWYVLYPGEHRRVSTNQTFGNRMPAFYFNSASLLRAAMSPNIFQP
jgi:hypothetical protein